MRISIKGDCKAVASDFSLATSIALCAQAKQLPFCDSFSQLNKWVDNTNACHCDDF